MYASTKAIVAKFIADLVARKLRTLQRRYSSNKFLFTADFLRFVELYSE